MAGFNSTPYRSTGTIAPSVFVMRDATGPNLCKQATAGVASFAIAQQGQKSPPGLLGSDAAVAAEAGDQLLLYTSGDYCPIKLGGTVAAGDYLKPTTGGVAIAASSGDIASAVAVQGGATGQLVQCVILDEGSKMP